MVLQYPDIIFHPRTHLLNVAKFKNKKINFIHHVPAGNRYLWNLMPFQKKRSGARSGIHVHAHLQASSSLIYDVYSIHSTGRHANLSLSLAHPGRSEGLPDKQNYIEIFNSSQRLDQGVNV